MRVLERTRRPHDANHVRDREWRRFARRARSDSPSTNGIVVRQAVRLACRQHWNDVRLLQRRRRADLPLESLGADARASSGEDFDDDLAPEPDFIGHEDARHPTAAELALEGVGSTQRRLELGLKVTTRRMYSAEWDEARCVALFRRRCAVLQLPVVLRLVVMPQRRLNQPAGRE